MSAHASLPSFRSPLKAALVGVSTTMLLLCSTPSTAYADAYDEDTMLADMGFNWVTGFGESYVNFGGAMYYFVMDGLAMGAGFHTSIGRIPQVTTISMYGEYIFHQARAVQPWIGGFYHHGFITGAGEPLDGAGLRGGLMVPVGSKAILRAGAVWERRFRPNDGRQLYPLLGVGFAL